MMQKLEKINGVVFFNVPRTGRDLMVVWIPLFGKVNCCSIKSASLKFSKIDPLLTD